MKDGKLYLDQKLELFPVIVFPLLRPLSQGYVCLFQQVVENSRIYMLVAVRLELCNFQ